MISTFSQPILSANLPSPEERERQKHRILENLHGCIKEVQLQGCADKHSEDLPTPLTIHDSSCQQLCRHLDQAFLHGLRHLANGYWLFIKEFTHKDIVDVIQNLKNVGSNLGRGRAWLFISLNESSLESYIRTIRVNPAIVDKYYISEAFIKDEQRMEMLITMVSGLEYSSFQMEIDTSFLNHSIVPIESGDLTLMKKEASSFTSFSMNSSFLSQKSLASIESAISQDEDSGFVNMESSQISLQDLNPPCSEDLGQRIHPNCSDFSDEQYMDFSDNTLEVIHVAAKRKKQKTKTNVLIDDGNNVQKSSSHESIKSSSINQQESNVPAATVTENISTPISEEVIKSTLEIETHNDQNEHSLTSSVLTSHTGNGDSIKSEQTSTELHCERKHSVTSSVSLLKTEENDISVESQLQSDSANQTNIDKSMPENTNDNNSLVSKDMPDIKINNKHESSMQHSNCLSEVKPAIKLRDKSDASERKNPAKRVSFEIDLLGNDSTLSAKSSVLCEDTFKAVETVTPSLKDDRQSSSEENYELEMLRGSPEGQETPALFSSTQSNSNEISVYDNKCDKSKSKPSSFLSGFPKLNKSEVTEISRQSAQEIDTELKRAMTEKRENTDIKVDNNTLLRLMLDVFFEGEQFYKMFHATVGHTEDKIILLFPILTDKRLYLLEYHLHQCEFILAMVIAYTEIDYILLGINYQTILIVCKRRRKHFALCTGDECLTRSIVSSLEVAIRRWCPGSNLPCVYTNSMMQTIGLQKFIANEIHLERHEISITYYALIYWEDPQLPPSPHSPAGPSKEGYFMYCYCQGESVTNNYKSQWIPGYFVLRAGVLYHFKEKGNVELESYINLHSPEFRGCQRSSCWKRPHVFELQLKDDRTLYLAAANDYEASDWLQAFVQTVSCKVLLEDDVKPYKSCCLAISSQRLFICQEDLEMFTFTSLASANLSDIVAVKVDRDKKSPYCILEFESVEANISSGDWILYFNSDNEVKKFLKVLEESWKELFQVSLTVTENEDEMTEKKCRERIGVIHSSWRLGYDMLKEPAAVMKYCPSPQ